MIAIAVVPLRRLGGEGVARIRPPVTVCVGAAELVHEGGASDGRAIISEHAGRVVTIGVTVSITPLCRLQRVGVVHIGIAVTIGVHTAHVGRHGGVARRQRAVVVLVGDAVIIGVLDEAFPDVDVEITGAGQVVRAELSRVVARSLEATGGVDDILRVDTDRPAAVST